MENETKAILPREGIWTVEALAVYLELPPRTVQRKLAEFGVQILSFSSRYRHKIFRLQDIRKKNCKCEDSQSED